MPQKIPLYKFKKKSTLPDLPPPTALEDQVGLMPGRSVEIGRPCLRPNSQCFVCQCPPPPTPFAYPSFQN